MSPCLNIPRVAMAIVVTVLTSACSDATAPPARPADSDVLSVIATLQSTASPAGTSTCPAGGTQAIRSEAAPGPVLKGLREIRSSHEWTWSECAALVGDRRVVLNGRVVSADTVIVDEVRLAIVSRVGVQKGSVAVRVGSSTEPCDIELRTLQANGMLRLEGTLCGRRVTLLLAVPARR